MLPARDTRGLAREVHIDFLASPAAIRDSLAHLLGVAPLAGLPREHRGTAELVLAEVLNNVAEHAYAAGPGKVAVTLIATPAGILCQVIDQGAAMPGGHLPAGRLPDADTPLQDLPEGGFGWHLIRALTRDLTYDRTGGCNRLTFLLPCDG